MAAAGARGLLLLLGKAAAMLAELLVYLDGTQAGVLQSLMEVPRLEGEGQLFLGVVDRQEVLRDTQPEVVGASRRKGVGVLNDKALIPPVCSMFDVTTEYKRLFFLYILLLQGVIIEWRRGVGFEPHVPAINR